MISSFQDLPDFFKSYFLIISILIFSLVKGYGVSFHKSDILLGHFFPEMKKHQRIYKKLRKKAVRMNDIMLTAFFLFPHYKGSTDGKFKKKIIIYCMALFFLYIFGSHQLNF